MRPPQRCGIGALGTSLGTVKRTRSCRSEASKELNSRVSSVPCGNPGPEWTVIAVPPLHAYSRSASAFSPNTASSVVPADTGGDLAQPRSATHASVTRQNVADCWSPRLPLREHHGEINAVDATVAWVRGDDASVSVGVSGRLCQIPCCVFLTVRSGHVSPSRPHP